jgi:hypothetical protein
MKKYKEVYEIRAFVDLKVSGNAKGGAFIKSKVLHDKIKEIEAFGLETVVGVVYDGTSSLEILTKPNQEITDMKNNKLLN